MKATSRLRELPFITWPIFVATIMMTSVLIARDPESRLPWAMMTVLIIGFVKIVGRLIEPQ